MEQRPLILVTNDDGINAKGINTLINILRPLGDLFVVAPDIEQSGKSSAFTAHSPIKYKSIKVEDGLTVYSCSGTPVDCVKLALGELLFKQPDLVVSGINNGNNSSINVHYSGTTGATNEAALKGIPSIAFSSIDYSPNADFDSYSDYIVKITQAVIEGEMPFGSYLNVNFPVTEQIQGIKVCRMGYSKWVDEVVECEHPRGGHYFWLAGEFINDEPNETDTDTWALEHDYVAITPVTTDVTDHKLLNSIKLAFGI